MRKTLLNRFRLAIVTAIAYDQEDNYKLSEAWNLVYKNESSIRAMFNHGIKVPAAVDVLLRA